jgi:hypothetical protein
MNLGTLPYATQVARALDWVIKVAGVGKPATLSLAVPAARSYDLGKATVRVPAKLAFDVTARYGGAAVTFAEPRPTVAAGPIPAREILSLTVSLDQVVVGLKGFPDVSFTLR